MAVITECPNCGRSCCDNYKPYCNNCVDELVESLQSQLDQQEADNKALREALEIQEQTSIKFNDLKYCQRCGTPLMKGMMHSC